MDPKVRKSILNKYVTLTGERPFRQIAHFLAWATKHLPGEYFSYQEITRAICGYKVGSRVGADLVKVVDNAMSRAKDVLEEKYKLGYFNKRNVGARATIGSDDITEYTLRPKVSRLASARKAVIKTAAIVPPNGFTDAANQRFFKTVKSSGLLSSSADAEVLALLPPKK